MTDPTPEQIEAAYQAWLNFPHKRGPQNAENAIRAALIAAAGVTPQEPGEDRVMQIAGHLASIHTLTTLDGEAIARAALALAAPVQVDEAKLAEVIRGVVDRRPYDDEIRHHIRGIENAVARSVADWLRGGVR